MVVVAILALILRIVSANLGALVPRLSLDSATKQLEARIGFLRTEARLRSKRYELQIDLDGERWRYVLPMEERTASDQPIPDESAINSLTWNAFPDDVDALSAGLAKDRLVEQGIYAIVFDQDGVTADQAMFFQLKSDPRYVWTLKLYGLTGSTEIATSVEGKIQPLEPVGEFMF